MIGGMLSQNILNLVDTLMIGQLGTDALAGSGIGSFFILCFYLLALSGAPQVFIPWWLDIRAPTNLDSCSISLMIGLSIGLLLSILITIATMHYSYFLVSLFSKEPTISQVEMTYLSYRIIGLPFFSICLVIRGFWNGFSSPIRYLLVIVGIHTLNVMLNFLFIFGTFGAPELGAAGAGLASTISLMIGAFIYLFDIRSFFMWRICLRQLKLNAR